jgi:4-hydroxy-tetrahydrodipicolinate reductase
MPLKVIQWTTGNVGRRALRAIVDHPDLDLVGVYAHGPDKVGRDAAELCGLDGDIGVRATDDIDQLIGLGADACSYNPMWPDLDHLCRLLEAGVNVCSTAAFITGRNLAPRDRDRLAAAAERGGSTMFGTGVNPGFANLFALVSTQICDRVDAVRVTESVDSTDYASKDTEESVGYGMALDDPRLVTCTREGTRVFEEAVALIGDALGVEFDEVVFDVDYGAASADRDLGYMRIAEGSVSSIDGRWRGRAFGRDVVVAHFQWLKGAREDAPFTIRHGYYVEVDGEPSVRSQFQIRPGRGWSEPDYMGLGMIMTAMPAVNAIPAVVAAPPGIATHATLPLVCARGYVAGPF